VTSTKLSYVKRGLVLGLVATFGGVYHPGIFPATQPPWFGVVITGGGFGHRWGRNGEFCVAVGPATRSAGILAKSDNGAGCLFNEPAIRPTWVVRL